MEEEEDVARLKASEEGTAKATFFPKIQFRHNRRQECACKCQYFLTPKSQIACEIISSTLVRTTHEDNLLNDGGDWHVKYF